jgi:hypothetical protein
MTQKYIDENDNHKQDNPLSSHDLAHTDFYINVYFKGKLKFHFFLDSGSFLVKSVKFYQKFLRAL